MNASVAFFAGVQATTATSTIAVPMSAVRDNAVFVVKGDSVVRSLVELGSPTGDGIAVKSGIAAGDEIVVNPPEKLSDGSAIRRQGAK